jgi:3-oxoacyl-[acyl-carrier protein] reductase
MLLAGKNAVIYGAGGSVGSAAARAFAREGAAVFLAGRTRAPLEALAEEIARAGGIAETAVVDALDEAAVVRHADAIVAGAGSLESRSTRSRSITSKAWRSPTWPRRTSWVLSPPALRRIC